MYKFFQKNAFILGSVLGFLFLIAANYVSYFSNTHFMCDDCGWGFGFPFHLYMEGGFFSFKEILWLGLFADILIAIAFSFLIGLTFKFVRSKYLASYEMKIIL
jgi:hypothetical protein